MPLCFRYLNYPWGGIEIIHRITPLSVRHNNLCNTTIKKYSLVCHDLRYFSFSFTHIINVFNLTNDYKPH